MVCLCVFVLCGDEEHGEVKTVARATISKATACLCLYIASESLGSFVLCLDKRHGPGVNWLTAAWMEAQRLSRAHADTFGQTRVSVYEVFGSWRTECQQGARSAPVERRACFPSRTYSGWDEPELARPVLSVDDMMTYNDLYSDDLTCRHSILSPSSIPESSCASMCQRQTGYRKTHACG